MTNIQNKNEYRRIQVVNVSNQYKFNLDNCFSARETSSILSSVQQSPFTQLDGTKNNNKKTVIAERGFDPRTSELWDQHASTACGTRLTSVQKNLINNSHFKKTKPGLILVCSCISCLPIFAQLLVIIQIITNAILRQQCHHHFTLNVPCVPIIPTFLLCSHRHLGTLTNRSCSKETFQRHAKQSGAVEACWAHNPGVCLNVAVRDSRVKINH